MKFLIIAEDIVQTNNLSYSLKDHDVIIMSNTIEKHNSKKYKQNEFNKTIKEIEPDTIIIINNIRNIKTQGKIRLPTYLWLTVESEPLNAITATIIEQFKEIFTELQIVSTSKLGSQMFKGEYIPYSIDMNIFKPSERKLFHKNKFMIGFFTKNIGYPSPDAIEHNLMAISRYMRDNTDTYLYLHCSNLTGIIDDKRVGIDIKFIIDILNLPTKRIIYSENKIYSLNNMRDIYNSLDVVVNASSIEYDGYNILEAQSCGVPIITTNYSIMSDMTYNGIAIKWNNKIYSSDNTFWVIPDTGKIEEALYYINGTMKCIDKKNTYYIDKIKKTYSLENVNVKWCNLLGIKFKIEKVEKVESEDEEIDFLSM